jgi:hypothetical protein
VFHIYVTTTCSIYFICFRCMLQVFYLVVAYVTMTMLQVYVPNIFFVSVVCYNFSFESYKSRS